MTLTVGSLFSGIGGLDLGLERAGMKVIWQSEIDPYACRVLSKHWPEVVNHGNIKEINWSEVERPNVLCGGYPCQPFSTAGKRKGEEDARHLWPWVREAISELRPRYAILENVRGHLSLGGLTVIGELATIGYDAEWRIVSAASVGANHKRDRIIIVAYPSGEQLNERGHRNGTQTNGEWISLQRATNRGNFSMADTNGTSEQLKQEWEISKRHSPGCGEQISDSIGEWGREDRSLEQSRETVYGGRNHLRGKNGITSWEWWKTEPNVGRVAHGIPSRVDRLRGLGNAVVPQVAETIGRLVVAHYESTMA